MAKTLDFKALKKQYLTVKLGDEKNTVLMVGTPTKTVLDSFLGMKDSLIDGNVGDEAIEELYEVVAKIMSHNKGGVKITKEEIEALLDFEDIIVFVRAYGDFISEVTGSKN